MIAEPQTFSTERKGACFSVRPWDGSRGGRPILCILSEYGNWIPVATFNSDRDAEKFVDYMSDFLETYQPTEQ